MGFPTWSIIAGLKVLTKRKVRLEHCVLVSKRLAIYSTVPVTWHWLGISHVSYWLSDVAVTHSWLMAKGPVWETGSLKGVYMIKRKLTTSKFLANVNRRLMLKICIVMFSRSQDFLNFFNAIDIFTYFCKKSY